jgi:hypothetical protein
MSGPQSLRVVLVKPSKYAADGAVERFRRGFMPNSTLPYLASLTPDRVEDSTCQTHAIDEYVQTDLSYLDLLRTAVAGYSAQSRLGAWRRMHPMAGGIWRVCRDREEDYRQLRRATYGVARAALPENLSLSAADEEINRTAKLGVPR